MFTAIELQVKIMYMLAIATIRKLRSMINKDAKPADDKKKNVFESNKQESLFVERLKKQAEQNAKKLEEERQAVTRKNEQHSIACHCS